MPSKSLNISVSNISILAPGELNSLKRGIVSFDDVAVLQQIVSSIMDF